MIITGINDFEHYNDLTEFKFDFSMKGLYLINVASGKKSIIEKFLFDRKVQVSFLNKDQERVYKLSHSLLISHLPREIRDMPTTIYDYINKGNDNVKVSDIDKLLGFFGLSDIYRETKFSYLSKEEKQILAIIATLLKNTPYVFLDDPTNNLSDELVKKLSGLLTEYAKERTFVINSSDMRLKLVYNATYVFGDNEVVRVEYSKNDMNNLSDFKYRRKEFFCLLKGIVTPKRYILFTLMCFIIIGFLGFFIGMSYLMGYEPKEKYAIQENYIVMYEYPDPADMRTRDYIELEGLTNGDYSGYVAYRKKDIEDIASCQGVSRILILNQRKTADYDIMIYSFPEVLYEGSETLMEGFDLGINRLEDGRLPNDNTNEVALSKDLLIEKFGYTEGNVNTAIGDFITYDGQIYEVVGFCERDYFVVGFNENQNYSLYKYSPDTIDEFLAELSAFDEDYERLHLTALVTVDDGYEKPVLDHLTVKYNYTEFISDTYNEIYFNAHNAQFLSIIFPITLVIFGFAGLFILLIMRHFYSMDVRRIADFEVYYLDKWRMKTAYIGVYISNFIISNFISTGISFFFLLLMFDISWLIFAPICLSITANMFALFLPTLLYVTIKMFKKRKKDYSLMTRKKLV